MGLEIREVIEFLNIEEKRARFYSKIKWLNLKGKLVINREVILGTK